MERNKSDFNGFFAVKKSSNSSKGLVNLYWSLVSDETLLDKVVKAMYHIALKNV